MIYLIYIKGMEAQRLKYFAALTTLTHKTRLKTQNSKLKLNTLNY